MGETLSTISALTPQLSQMASQRLLLLFRKEAMMCSSSAAACKLHDYNEHRQPLYVLTDVGLSADSCMPASPMPQSDSAVLKDALYQ